MTAIAKPKATLKGVAGDPINVLQYTLANGLRLFMTVNADQPRVYTEIAVRVGSKYDPADTTGLAHYFEHMMFKGTDRFGSLDWAKEKVLLDQIEQLFEQRRRTADPEEKKRLYAEIDRLSSEAAKYAAANEYDKMASAMGAQGTNAYTWVEQTVYVNDIPSNEIKRWFQLESERFRRPVLRLFHTELETVFEEYNISQDRDFRKTYHTLQNILYPTHPYGTQTTLGRGEDLKNPSKTNIYRFFDQYYVPNNMALILSGDFDPQEVVTLAEQYFGNYQAKPVQPLNIAPQPALTQRVQRHVYGTEAPWVEMAWKLPGAPSEAANMLKLVSQLLYNQQAGVMDIHLLQAQQVLEAYAYPYIYEDYSTLVLYGKPREGQTLEDVEAKLLAQIERLRTGDFEEWLPQAVYKELKLNEIQSFEKNKGRTAALTNAFVTGVSWEQYLVDRKKMANVNHADVVAFAQQYLPTDAYAVVYKHQGEDKSVMKLEKPEITAVELDRDRNSDYAKAFLAEKTEDIRPEFVDFKKAIRHVRLTQGVPLKVVQDKESQLFTLNYVFEMGRLNDRRLSTLAQYLSFLGTDQYSASAMQQAFYKLAVHCTAECHENTFYVTLTGLAESFEEATALMEHLIHHAQPNREAFDNLVSDILQRRANDKSDKQVVMNKAMRSFAKHGMASPFKYRLSESELRTLLPQDLTSLLHDLFDYRHEVFYYGPLSVPQVKQVLHARHTVPPTLKAVPSAKRFVERGQRRNEVYFVHFPMVQADLYLLSKGTQHFNEQEYIFSEWYNHYFGYGLSSIVFQDIRESKALAYSAYAYAATPERKRQAHFLSAYVGTQPDKLRDAIEAFQTILEDMPVSPLQMDQARQSIVKQMAVSRLRKADIYWTWRNSRRRGVNTDLRETVYKTLQVAHNEDLQRFHAERIKGRRYTWMVMGDRDRVNFDLLKKIGPVKELSLEEVFGY